MELLFLLLFCAIIWILFMVFFGAMMGKMFQIGKKIDEQVGIEGFGMVSLIVIVFFIIPFVVTGLLWNSGFFKNAFEVEDQGEGLFLVLLPFWVAIGLIVLITTAIILWQRVREKRERGGEREKWQAEAELSESLERQSEEIREMAEREKKKWQAQLSELQERQAEPSIPPPIENTVESIPVQKSTTGTATTVNWFYYDTNGEKISVTPKELKALAASGKITPGTIIETPEGKSAKAKRVKGLTFAESSMSPPIENKAHNLPYDIDHAREVMKKGIAEANARDQSRPAPVSQSVVFTAPFPTYTGVGSEYMVSIDEIDALMGYMKESDRGREIIDDTAVRYLKELIQIEPGKWEPYLKRQQEFMVKSAKHDASLLTSIGTMIDNTYKTMQRQDVNPSSEFVQAWDQKVREFQQFIASR